MYRLPVVCVYLKWLDSAMDLKRRLLPIAIALVLIAMVFISWTPNWESGDFIRSTKPYVHFEYQFQPAKTQLLADVTEDVDNRLDVRHEWHKVGEQEAQYDVVVVLLQEQQTVQLDATLYRNDERFDHIVVRGQTEVKHELSGRLVALLTDRIELAHQQQSQSEAN